MDRTGRRPIRARQARPRAEAGAAPAGPAPWSRRRFLAVLGAAPLAGSLVAACAPADSDGAPVTGLGGATEPLRIPYGAKPSQFGELWLPAGAGPHPVVVLVHGGFWRVGYDRTLMDDLAADVAARGWAAWNVEYRRVGEAGGGWPGTLSDVGFAIDHLAKLASGTGPSSRVDVSRVAVAGHSAGGHLAAWSATRPGLPAGAPGAAPKVRPVAVVSQAGVLDLRAAAKVDLGAGAAQGLIGAVDQVPERYDLASPIERLPLGVPIRCVHGRQDDIVPISQSQSFVTAAKAVGDRAELVPFTGDHFPVLDPTHESWTGTVAWLKPLLAR